MHREQFFFAGDLVEIVRSYTYLKVTDIASRSHMRVASYHRATHRFFCHMGFGSL